MQKTNYFYSHLISYDSIVIELNKLDLKEEEKIHLLSIIDSTLHHTILDNILSHLSEEDKKIFLHYIIENDDLKIWDFLNKKVDNIEEKIKQAALDLEKELHKDIHEVKKKQ